MPHAFRSAAHIEAENAQRKLDRLTDRWTATRDTWYDGTAESVERRLANLDEVISFARHLGSRLHQSKVGSHALAMLPQLRADREQLVSLRQQVTGAHWFDESSPEGQAWLNTLGGGPDPRAYHSQQEYRDAYALSNQLNHLNQYADPQERERLMNAARDFVESENTTNREELLIRAQRLMEERTWDWTPQSARQATRDFLGAVIAVAPEAHQPQRTAGVEAVEDFDAQLMFT